MRPSGRDDDDDDIPYLCVHKRLYVRIRHVVDMNFTATCKVCLEEASGVGTNLGSKILLNKIDGICIKSNAKL